VAQALAYDEVMTLKNSLLLLLLGCAACGQSAQAGPFVPTSCTTPGDAGAAAGNDQDRDGLDDATELMWAEQYLPFLSISPGDDCPTAGIVVRVSPHPTAAGFVHIVYDVLYNDDCGIGGHVGDDERFATTIDPSMPPPAGIVAIKAIAHKGSLCEKASSCGRCAGLTACQTLVQNGAAFPAIWASRDKHGNYVDRTTTCLFDNTCLDVCDDRSAPAQLPVVNVGEPCFPLVNNLTTQGFITAQNGWTHQELFNYDPWSGLDFGGGSVVSSDLTDPAFDTPACP